VIPSTLTKITY